MGKYTVKRGDNLSKIAKECDVNMSDIFARNNIPDPDLIFAGQELSIPSPHSCTQESKRSAKTLISENFALAASDPSTLSVQEIQIRLSALGYRHQLGRWRADGKMGSSTRNAISAWQAKNDFRPTGILTADQQKSLVAQSEKVLVEHGTVKHKVMTLLHGELMELPPVRAAVVWQALNHIGVTEFFEKADVMENLGPAVKQYAGMQGVPWCAAFVNWLVDQVENHAGVGDNSFYPGNNSTISSMRAVKRIAPESLHTAADYIPQVGDIMFHHGYEEKAKYSHTSIVLAFDAVRGVITTIDGNYDNRVRLGVWQIDPEDPSVIGNGSYENGRRHATFANLEQLPNYKKMSRRLADFNPTKTKDLTYMTDIGAAFAALRAIQSMHKLTSQESLSANVGFDLHPVSPTL